MRMNPSSLTALVIVVVGTLPLAAFPEKRNDFTGSWTLPFIRITTIYLIDF
jgi:hypothetical protein